MPSQGIMGGNLRRYWSDNVSFTARKANGSMGEFKIFASQYDAGYYIAEKGDDGKWHRINDECSWNFYILANKLYNYLNI